MRLKNFPYNLRADLGLFVSELIRWRPCYGERVPGGYEVLVDYAGRKSKQKTKRTEEKLFGYET